MNAMRRFIGEGAQAVMCIVLVALAVVMFATPRLSQGVVGVGAYYFFPLIMPLAAVGLIGAMFARVLRVRTIEKTAIIPALLAFGGLWTVRWLPPSTPYPYPASIARVQPHAFVRVPMDTVMRVLWGGDNKKHNYHGVLPGDRWAYDLSVDPVPDEFGGGPVPKLDEYGCWGRPVVAPAAGRVSSARDSVPDNVPGTRWKMTLDNRGNYVSIQLATGTYIVINHLKKGSVTVRTGDSVTEGAVIGACGASGLATVPHVHINHQRRSPEHTLGKLDFTLGLPLFFRDHTGAPMPLGGGGPGPDGKWVWTGDTIRAIRGR